MFDALSDRLQTALAGLTGRGRIFSAGVDVDPSDFLPDPDVIEEGAARSRADERRRPAAGQLLHRDRGRGCADARRRTADRWYGPS